MPRRRSTQSWARRARPAAMRGRSPRLRPTSSARWTGSRARSVASRRGRLERAALAALPGTPVVAHSAVEETAPLAGMAQPVYLNQMVLLETRLTPRELLEACQRIERAEGRVRDERWGARTLDLDIVRFGR